MKGRVVRSTGAWYEVLDDQHQRFTCKVRGKFRLEGIKESNPVAVGDYVTFDWDNQVGFITEILPRHNHILRQSVKKTGHSSVLAANIDQVMIIATLKQPRTSLGFIDRVLVTAESFRIPQVLIFNKRDILDDEEKSELQNVLHNYASLGVVTKLISTQHADDIASVKELLTGKTTLITGHSGVGKSTLLNKISPGIQQATQEVSEFTEKGTHTTTFAEMFQLNATTFIIDTPGIKEWGLVNMEPQEISDYFPEMRERRLNCKFGARCLHINEPKCAVLEALENNEISYSRYQSYISMVMPEDNRK